MTHRRFEDGELISNALPAWRMRVDPPLSYAGASSFDIKDVALAERHYFVDVDGPSVRRMLVVQFEGFLDSNDEVYRYGLPDPVTLGGETYGSWVFGFSVADATAPELADTLHVLSGHGLELEDEQIFFRLARIVGDDARHEVLIFYHENVRDLGTFARRAL